MVTDVSSRKEYQVHQLQISFDMIQRVKDSWKEDHKLQEIVDTIRMAQHPCKCYTFDNEVLKLKGKLVVGSVEELKTEILQQFHNSIIGGHSGYELTYRRVRDHVYWKGMQNRSQKVGPTVHIC